MRRGSKSNSFVYS